MAQSSETWTAAEFAEYGRTGKTPARFAAAVPATPAAAVPNKAEHKAEREIHTQICQELNRRGIDYVHAAMNKRSPLPEGWPDFTIFPASGHAWFAEIKTLTGQLSKEQEERKAHLEAAGYPVYVPRSFEQFKVILLDRAAWEDSTPIKP